MPQESRYVRESSGPEVRGTRRSPRPDAPRGGECRQIPIIAARCLEASLVDPPKLTPGTSVEFAKGADEVLSKGSVAGVSGRTCDIECDGTTVKNVLIDKVRRFVSIPEGTKVGALQKCDIVLRVLKPALEGVDVGAFASFVNGKASIPETADSRYFHTRDAP